MCTMTYWCMKTARWFLNNYYSQLSAVGYYQMEPATHDDIWSNFFKYRTKLGIDIDANALRLTAKNVRSASISRCPMSAGWLLLLRCKIVQCEYYNEAFEFDLELDPVDEILK